MMEIDGYIIDAEISGEPVYENEVTAYPVEDGVDFVDHVRRIPTSLNVEGIISDTPIGDVKLQREIDGELPEDDQSGEGPTTAAHARLLEIHTRREPINVTCALGSFDNMVMLTFAPKKEGGSIRFTASFKYLRIVQNDRTVVRVLLPLASNKDNFRNLPTEMKDNRGREIERDIIESGPNRGTSVYHYKDGTPVPDEIVDKATRETNAVRVDYVNGQAVPHDPADFQPYKRKERWWWPEAEKTEIPSNSVFAPKSDTTPLTLPFNGFR